MSRTPGDVVDLIAELRSWGRMPLALDGWSRLSVWGYDDATGSLFAQLWQDDDSPRAEPRVWITPGRWPATTSPETLAEYVARGTGCTESEALLAMSAGAPPGLKELLASSA